jgi:hypothetical protein
MTSILLLGELSDPPTPGQSVSVQLSHRAPAVAGSVVESPVPDNTGRLSTARRALSRPVSQRCLPGRASARPRADRASVQMLGTTG